MSFLVHSFSSVLDTVIEELKKILKKDFYRRMIEGTAFKTYEAWWDEQENNFKVKNYFFLDELLLGKALGYAVLLSFRYFNTIILINHYIRIKVLGDYSIVVAYLHFY